jgi:hypothetical protein
MTAETGGVAARPGYRAVSTGAGALQIARKEASELLLGARGLSWLLTVSAVFSGFAMLIIGNSELSLLDNAQVVHTMVTVATIIGALIAIVQGVDAIGGERERGSLVPLLLVPLPRSALALGKLGGLLTAWAATMVLALPYLWAVGSTGQSLASGIVALALGTPVVLAFGAFALGFGARLGSIAGALATALAVLVLACSPLLIGPGLRHTALGAVFDAVNPLSVTLDVVDAVVVDGEPLGTQIVALATVTAWAIVGSAFAWDSVRELAR